MISKNLNSRLAAIESNAAAIAKARQEQQLLPDLTGLSPAELVARYRDLLEQIRNSPEGKARTARMEARMKGLSDFELVQLCREVMRGGSV